MGALSPIPYTPPHEKIRETLDSVPEPILGTQYFATPQSTGIQRLMWAMLEDSVFCLTHRVNSEKGKLILRDEVAWVKSNDFEYVFSFVNICSVLGLDVDYWRKGMLKLVGMQVERKGANGEPLPPGINYSPGRTSPYYFSIWDPKRKVQKSFFYATLPLATVELIKKRTALGEIRVNWMNRPRYRSFGKADYSCEYCLKPIAKGQYYRISSSSSTTTFGQRAVHELCIPRKEGKKHVQRPQQPVAQQESPRPFPSPEVSGDSFLYRPASGSSVGDSGGEGLCDSPELAPACAAF